MTASLLGLAMLFLSGSVLVLSELRWFRRPRLVDRISPYVYPAKYAAGDGLLSVTSFKEVIGPLSQSVADALARALGVTDDLHRRLERVHSPSDASDFRTRQMGVAGSALGLATAVSIMVSPPPLVAATFVGGAPLAAFSVIERRSLLESRRWQRRTVSELPVIAEQLGTLITAGWSLTAATLRIAERGRGVCASDLERVHGRMRQGLTEVEALREWAVRVGVDDVAGLVAILAMNNETDGLGRLVTEHARSLRREAHRRTIEDAERRTQLVWIPVTVAALVPGVILMAVPFVDALSLFAG